MDPSQKKIQEPKISLGQLWMAFKQSASDTELDDASRRLAARMCVLVRHAQILNMKLYALSRTSAATSASVKDLDTQLADTLKIISPLLDAHQESSAADAGQAPDSSEGEAADADADIIIQDDDDVNAQALADQANDSPPANETDKPDQAPVPPALPPVPAQPPRPAKAKQKQGRAS